MFSIVDPHHKTKRVSALERLLAKLLGYGTWIASFIVAIGIARAFVDANDVRMMKAGIGCLILLPMLRVLLMLFVFLRERDYRLAIAAALVLAIIVAGVVIGVHRGSAIAG
jgi:uncharacterized membrane protein